MRGPLPVRSLANGKVGQLLLALMLALAPGLRAQTSVPVSTATITLRQVLATVERDNPELQASRQAWLAAAETPAVAGAFEDPSVTVTKMTEPLETRAGPVEGKVTASQKIPFYGKRGLRREGADLAAEMAHQAFLAKGLEVAARAVRFYYELYFLDRTIAILNEQSGLVDHFARVADKKYASGRGPQAMSFRAQVELAQISNELITAQQERLSRLAALNSVLNRPPRAPIAAPQTPPKPESLPSSETLLAQAVQERPEIRTLRALEGRRSTERRLAIRRYFPDFTIGYEYTQIGGGTTNMPFDGKDAQGFMVGLNIPLWLGKNRAAVREASASEKAANLSLTDAVNRTGYEVEDLSVRAETSARLFKLYEDTVLPVARSAFSSSQSGYEGDQVSFLDLLDSERALLRFELEHERHRADFQIRLAELSRAVGRSLSVPGGERP
jgi:cobalt-zinc-cadmium efflux system outer membrane protein